MSSKIRSLALSTALLTAVSAASAQDTVERKALLVTDGIFQGLGALQTVGSILFVETRREETKVSHAGAGDLRAVLGPAVLGGGSGYGVVAACRF
jgi:hypothetical protein